jgi:arylsulfatase A-like enzyme
MPTILDCAGLEHSSDYQGREVERMRGQSFADVASGTKEGAYAEDALVGGEMINGKWVHKGDYKAVQVAKPFGLGSWRLYNLATDPGDTTDLFATKPAILEELETAWGQYANDIGVVLSN